jgi:hypothetical protein
MADSDSQPPILPYRRPPRIPKRESYFPSGRSTLYRVTWWIAFIIILLVLGLVLAVIGWLKWEQLHGRF